MWISSQTRPDIAFDVCQLGASFKNSGEQDIKYLNKVLTHLKQYSVQIKYKQLGKDDNLKLIYMQMLLMVIYLMVEAN